MQDQSDTTEHRCTGLPIPTHNPLEINMEIVYCCFYRNIVKCKSHSYAQLCDFKTRNSIPGVKKISETLRRLTWSYLSEYNTTY